ncbi:MAG: hypothetical protein IJV29_18495 [Butyrivibrio sp.]|nr:hypothetical protein [Butyrivibrio sp.]
MTTNEKIIEILKRHPEGGEKFSMLLTLMLRSDQSIGQAFVDWVCNYDFMYMQVPVVGADYTTQLSMNSQGIGVVVTGRFGHYLMSNFAKQLTKTFGDIIVVNGGIREGEQPEIFKTSLIPYSYYILLDDSYYSGTTANSIAKALQRIDPNACLVQAFVVYDGSKENKNLVKSMFRYYGEEETD